MLRELYLGLSPAGKTIRIAEAASDEAHERLGLDLSAFALSAESALEECEDALLQATGYAEHTPTSDVPLRDFDLLSEFDLEELATLAEHLTERAFAAGAVMIKEDAAADRMYFLLSGSVELCSGGKLTVLLASINAGNVVGELALLGGDRPRTANVVAATAVRCLELKASALAPLSRRNPEIVVKLSIAVARALAERLRRANATIRSLTR